MDAPEPRPEPWERTDHTRPIPPSPEERIWEKLVELLSDPATIETDPLADPNDDKNEGKATQDAADDDNDDPPPPPPKVEKIPYPPPPPDEEGDPVPDGRKPLVPKEETWPPKLPPAKQADPPPKTDPSPQPRDTPTPPIRDPYDAPSTPKAGPPAPSGNGTKPTPKPDGQTGSKPKPKTPGQGPKTKPTPSGRPGAAPTPKPKTPGKPTKPTVPGPVRPNRPASKKPTPRVPIPEPFPRFPPGFFPPVPVPPKQPPSSLPASPPSSAPVQQPSSGPSSEPSGSPHNYGDVDEAELRKDPLKKEAFVRKEVAKFFRNPRVQRIIKKLIEDETYSTPAPSTVRQACEAAAKAIEKSIVVSTIPTWVQQTVKPKPGTVLCGYHYATDSGPQIVVVRPNVNLFGEDEIFWTLVHEGLHEVLGTFIEAGDDGGAIHHFFMQHHPELWIVP
jgi:hypothetical protein